MPISRKMGMSTFMKYLRFAGFVLFVAAVTASAAVDPKLLSLMMPDAKAVAGIQVAQSQNTPFGRFLLTQIPPNAGLDNFVSSTGFDPRHDLTELVAATTGENQWLVAGHGAFQPARIIGLAGVAGAK